MKYTVSVNYQMEVDADSESSAISSAAFATHYGVEKTRGLSVCIFAPPSLAPEPQSESYHHAPDITTTTVPALPAPPIEVRFPDLDDIPF